MDPGRSVTGPDLDALAKIQEDTVRNLARRYTAQGYQISPEQVDLLIRTIQGEAARENSLGQQAVGNTMLNRMADGGSFDRLAAAYDANGLRYARTKGKSGVPANAGFRNTRPGSMDYNEGIEALMRPQSAFSDFTRKMPEGVKSAKQYYNPDIASPSWGGDNFIPLGNHVFGNEFQRTSGATLRNRQRSPIFGDAGSVTLDQRQYAEDTLNALDYEPEFQAPEEEQSPDWRASYEAPGENPIMAGLPGKEGNSPGSWQDIFSKLGATDGKQFKTASLGPDAGLLRGPTSYVIPGEIYRPVPKSRSRKQRYRPRKTRFAGIMEGVSGPYG